MVAAHDTAYRRLIDKLSDHGSTVQENGNTAKAQCPAHSDRNPSLSIKDIGGTLLVHCHAQCQTDDVMAALGLTMADLYDSPNGAEYTYPGGRVVHRSPIKEFWQSGNTKDRSLYRGDQIPDGPATVYVCEGEKDCDAIGFAGGIAVCSAMGASNADKADWSPLTGKHVIIVPDRDTAGHKYATDVTNKLAGIVASLTILEAKQGKDAADHIAADHGLNDFIPQHYGALAGMRDGTWLDAQEFAPLEYSVPSIIPEGLTILVGPPKSLKSWMVAAIGLGCADGTRVFGTLPVKRRPVLYLALEDGDRRLQDRFQLLQDGAPIPEWMHYITKATPDEVIPIIEAFLALYPDEEPLIILDTFGKIKPPKRPNQEAYLADYQAVGALKDAIDKRPGSSLLVVHHTRKMAATDFIDSVSGTQGITGAADCVLILKRERLSNEAVLSVTGRDVAEREYALQLKDDVRWWLDGIDLEEAAHKATKRKADAEETGKLGDSALWVLAFVNSRPQMTTGIDDVYEAWPEKSEEADEIVKIRNGIKQTLTRLWKRDRILRISRGAYMPHAALDTPGVTSVTNVAMPDQDTNPEPSTVTKGVTTDGGRVTSSGDTGDSSDTLQKYTSRASSSFDTPLATLVTQVTLNAQDDSPNAGEMTAQQPDSDTPKPTLGSPRHDLCWLCCKPKPIEAALCASCQAEGDQEDAGDQNVQ